MEVSSVKKETVERLRKIKKEKELTISNIIDMLEENGKYLSEATVKRVFSDNADPTSFKYRETIAPLADLLLDLYSDQSGTSDINSLKAMIKDKNMTISILVAKNEEIRADFDKRIAHLQKQIDSLEKHLDFREKVVERKDEVIAKLLDMVTNKE